MCLIKLQRHAQEHFKGMSLVLNSLKRSIAHTNYSCMFYSSCICVHCLYVYIHYISHTCTSLLGLGVVVYYAFRFLMYIWKCLRLHDGVLVLVHCVSTTEVVLPSLGLVLGYMVLYHDFWIFCCCPYLTFGHFVDHISFYKH